MTSKEDVLSWIKLVQDDPALLDDIESVTIGPTPRGRVRWKPKELDPDCETGFPGLVALWPKMPKLSSISISVLGGVLVSVLLVSDLSIELDTVTSLSLVDCFPQSVNPYDRPLFIQLLDVVPCVAQLSIDFGLHETVDPPAYHAKPLAFEQLSRLRFLNWHPLKTQHVAKLTKMLPSVRTLVLHEARYQVYPIIIPYLRCTWITGLGWTGANYQDPSGAWTYHKLAQLDLLRFTNLEELEFANGLCKKHFFFRLPPSLKELIIGEGVDCPIGALLELILPGQRKIPSLEWIHHNQIKANHGTYLRPKTDDELGTDSYDFNAANYHLKNDPPYDPAKPKEPGLAHDWVLPTWTENVNERDFADLIRVAAAHGVGVIGDSVDALGAVRAWRALDGAGQLAAEEDGGLAEERAAPLDSGDEADLAQMGQEAQDLVDDAGAFRPCYIERDALAWADGRLIGAFGKLFSDKARFYEVEKALHWTPVEAKNYDELPRYVVGHRALWGWDLQKSLEGRKPFFTGEAEWESWGGEKGVVKVG